LELPRLAFPEYQFRFLNDEPGQSLKIFDTIRKKYVVLTPEEWVRQHLLQFLVNERKFPQSLLSVEKKVLVNRLFRRTDIVVYSKSLQPLLIAECKSPSVKLSQAAFDQAARYNMTLGVLYFVISNGMQTYCCRIDHANKEYVFLDEIPSYGELSDNEV
jgi:hypothetical protein